MKLREKTRWPAAKSAEPIVSPSYARTGLPRKLNVELARAVEPLGRLRRQAHQAASSGVECRRAPGSSTLCTSFVRVSRSARNQTSQP